MSRGLRPAVALVTLAAVMPLASCGAGGGNGLQLTDDGCSYEGETSPAAGVFTIDFANKTEFFAEVALARLSDGKTIDDLQSYLEKARREFAEPGTLAAPPFPDFYEQVVRWGVEAEQKSVLRADLPAGTYGLMCFADNLPMWEVYRPRNSTSPARRSARRSARPTALRTSTASASSRFVARVRTTSAVEAA